MKKNIIESLIKKNSLTQNQAKEVLTGILKGEWEPPQIAALLVALRSKGESIEEITGFAQAMREEMKTIEPTVKAIDLCGTGGDGKNTFNISTTAAFVVAGAGVRVAKHGNRSISSQSGSADLLSALKINIHLPTEKIVEAIETIGLGFLFAPDFHPSIKAVVKIRKQLGIRTIFNLLGPLCNPAKVKKQLLGVFNKDLTDPIAKVLKSLGHQAALVIHGKDGSDELSLVQPNQISELKKDGSIKNYELKGEDYGFEKASLENLIGGNPQINASITKAILEGEKGPRSDTVVWNAAGAIYVSGKAGSMEEGIELAKESIDSKAALNVLKALQSF